MVEDRLFVPLKTEFFKDFLYNGKVYELRTYGRFREKYVYHGRRVELRKGFSGESVWGAIGDVRIGSLESILQKVDYRDIEPRTKSRAEFFRETRKIYPDQKKFIAFEVKLD
ncbi:hypothetical protein JW711_00990 [Candidatus Woesearchaeota archaeon]|nr:hypothetical protein [Candidatus Woesearchaeota archaeon]